MPVVLDVMFIAVLAALLVPALTRGSYQQLTEGWRAFPLLVGGYGIQAALGAFALPEDRWHDLGFGALIASYVLVLGFCGGNLLKRGMGVVLVGVACNALVITLNQGMPVDVPSDWQRDGFEATVKHRSQEPGDRLTVLGDIIVLREPSETVLSFGDLIMAFGLIDVTYWASRRPRRRNGASRSAATPSGAPRSARRSTRRSRRRSTAASSTRESADPPGDVDRTPSATTATAEAGTDPLARGPSDVIDLASLDAPVRRGDRELVLSVRRHPANGSRGATSDGGERAVEQHALEGVEDPGVVDVPRT